MHFQPVVELLQEYAYCICESVVQLIHGATEFAPTFIRVMLVRITRYI